MNNNIPESVLTDTQVQTGEPVTLAEAKESEFMDFVTIDMWTIIFTWGNLLILFLLLKKFLFKPVRKMMLDRENEVKSIYDDAEKSKSDAAELKVEYEEKLKNARDEAEDIIKNATRSATLKSEEIITEAHSTAAGIIKRADKQIEDEKRNAENELKNELGGLAVSIAEKVIKKELDGDKHKELIDSFISEMGDA